jgi:OOP family OmpA-OmpF porin
MGKRLTGDSSIFLMIDDVVISAANKKICPASAHIKDSLYAIVQRHIINKPVDTVASPVAVALPAKEKIDTVEINNIRFAFNSHTLANPDTLDMLKKFLSPGDVQKVKVIGYSDDSGTEAYNNTLSLKRAREISRLITARFSIPESLIEAEGRGISTLYAQKEQNRRVVIYIYRL